MRAQSIRLALIMGVLLAGCGTQPTAPAPDPSPSGGPSGVWSSLVNAPLDALAEQQYKQLDQDPSVAVLRQLASTLNVDFQITQQADQTVVLQSNAAQATHVDQTPQFTLQPVAIARVTPSSVRNGSFSALNVLDRNLHSAWAPDPTDQHPSLTFDLNGCVTVTALALKLSPEGVVVDVAVSQDGTTWQPLVTGLVPHYRTLDWIDLPPTPAQHVRLSFRGAQNGCLLVCNANVCGPVCTAPVPAATGGGGGGEASGSASPTASATLGPIASPTTLPSPGPTDSPSASPTASPTASPDASPTASPTSSPTSSPTASPSPSPTPSPTPTPKPSPSPTPTPKPSPTPTPKTSPTPKPSPTASP
ncbi:MAG TPA: discoidin domain-containing protein [Oscillatoriaceae cyanobacterium]